MDDGPVMPKPGDLATFKRDDGAIEWITVDMVRDNFVYGYNLKRTALHRVEMWAITVMPVRTGRRHNADLYRPDPSVE